MRTSGLSTLLLFSALAGCTEPAPPAAKSEPQDRPASGPSREPIAPSRGAIEWAPAPAPVANAAPTAANVAPAAPNVAPAPAEDPAAVPSNSARTTKAGELVIGSEDQLAPTRVPPDYRLRGGPHWKRQQEPQQAEPRVRE